MKPGQHRLQDGYLCRKCQDTTVEDQKGDHAEEKNHTDPGASPF